MVSITFGDEELTPIVKHGSERLDLDYKGPANWSTWNSCAKAELVRDMMAFANSGIPGYIVIGATDEGGVVRSYDGLDNAQFESFDASKIADKVKRYADPEVSFDLYKPTIEDRRYIVIRISPFQTVPHICIASCGEILDEAAIYIRGEGARTMKVPSSAYMREMVDRAIQISADDLVERIRRLVGTSKLGKLEIPDKVASEVAKIREALDREDV